jgi:FtsP/CotA-like multicopper oxidase with cupredoxin domain
MLPDALRSIEPLGAPATRAQLVLSEKVSTPGGHAGHGDTGAASGGETAAPEPVFLINDEVFPDVTPLTAAVGDVVEWDVVNDSEMSHPFHLHGFSFQVVPGDDGRGGLAGWYDTVDVPGKATLRLRFQPDDRPGLWMYHCHILEHAERGMIGLVDVTTR